MTKHGKERSTSAGASSPVCSLLFLDGRFSNVMWELMLTLLKKILILFSWVSQGSNMNRVVTYVQSQGRKWKRKWSTVAKWQPPFQKLDLRKSDSECLVTSQEAVYLSHTSSRPGRLDKIEPSEAIPEQDTWNDEDDGFFKGSKSFKERYHVLQYQFHLLGGINWDGIELRPLYFLSWAVMQEVWVAADALNIESTLEHFQANAPRQQRLTRLGSVRGDKMWC